MTPERNQPHDNQAGPRNSEQSETEATSQKYRPDWIIPDNGSSSKGSNPSERTNVIQEDRQSNSKHTQEDEDTLGIP